MDHFSYYNRFDETYPRYTAVKPSIILRDVYKTRDRIWPLCNSSRFSLVNEENVVKPPHNPTMSNNLRSEFNMTLFAAIPVRKPMIKLPVTFTVSVPIGME